MTDDSIMIDDEAITIPDLSKVFRDDDDVDPLDPNTVHEGDAGTDEHEGEDEKMEYAGRVLVSAPDAPEAE